MAVESTVPGEPEVTSPADIAAVSSVRVSTQVARLLSILPLVESYHRFAPNLITDQNLDCIGGRIYIEPLPGLFSRKTRGHWATRTLASRQRMDFDADVRY